METTFLSFIVKFNGEGRSPAHPPWFLVGTGAGVDSDPEGRVAMSKTSLHVTAGAYVAGTTVFQWAEATDAARPPRCTGRPPRRTTHSQVSLTPTAGQGEPRAKEQASPW